MPAVRDAARRAVHQCKPGPTGGRESRVHEMSNRTVAGAKTVRGTDPQLLMEKIVRERIYASRYWKEKCFGVTAETILDRALELTAVGGAFGGQQRPTEFLCLLLKLLQLQPSGEIVETYVAAEECKYLRCLGAVYCRLVFPPQRVHVVLEPLLNDFRKVRVRRKDGTFGLLHIDEVAWMLLREERVFDVILPRMPRRQVLEEAGELEPRQSLLQEEEVDAMERKDADVDEDASADADTRDRRERWKPDERHEPASKDATIDEEDALRARLGLKPLVR